MPFASLEHNAFLATIGMVLVRREPGVAEFDLLVDRRHTNRRGVLQGGVLATMLDAACGYAGLHEGSGTDGQAATLSLTVNYLARVDGGRLRAVGTVTGGGRRIYFSNGVVRTEDGTVVATAQGSFKRLAPRRSAASVPTGLGPVPTWLDVSGGAVNSPRRPPVRRVPGW